MMEKGGYKPAAMTVYKGDEKKDDKAALPPEKVHNLKPTHA